MVKTVAGKLIVLVALPLLALVLATGILSKDRWQQYRSASETEKLMNLAAVLGEVVHNLQVERGTSAAFAQSKGQRFGDEMVKRRAASDSSIRGFKDLIDADANERARQMLGVLARLPQVREEISALKKSGAETAAFYTNIIGELVKSLTGIATQDVDPVLGRKITAYLNLVKGKEWAGQERALLARMFVADQMSAADYRGFLERIHMQESNFTAFLAYASEKDAKEFTQAMERDFAREVEKMRAIALEKNTSGQFGVSGEVWFKQASARIDAMHEIEQSLSSEIQAHAHDMAAVAFRNLILFAALTVACIGTVFVFSFWIIRALLRQLGGEPAYVVAIAQEVANGQLMVDIHTKPDDTFSLLCAMKMMVDKLSFVVSAVNSSAQALAGVSGQVNASAQSLSQAASGQASSLEETASSMEQLTSTVKQNTDNAHYANRLAASASEVAIKGGAVVSEVVGTMSEISESARKIVDIIDVIDGIAFQTNILALNAAVEAARAGEQGRGFAVVASEVRNLAQRSATAAKEIKALIDNSVEKVDAGSKLVDQAGATMQEVVESIRRVTDVMVEISAASQEQTAGIEQVRHAVTRMNQTTQQNASASGELAATAKEMSGQAVQLQEAMDFFKLEVTAATA